MKDWAFILINGIIYGAAFHYFGYWVVTPMIALQVSNLAQDLIDR